VVVHEDQRRCRQFERTLDDLARIDRRVVDRAGLLQLIDDQLIALVEKQDTKLLFLGKSHGGAAIVDNARPR